MTLLEENEKETEARDPLAPVRTPRLIAAPAALAPVRRIAPPPTLTDIQRKAQQLRVLEDIALDPVRAQRIHRLRSVEMAPGGPAQKQQAMDDLIVRLFLRVRVGEKYPEAGRNAYRNAVARDMLGLERDPFSDADFSQAAKRWAMQQKAERRLLSGPEEADFTGPRRSAEIFMKAGSDLARHRDLDRFDREMRSYGTAREQLDRLESDKNASLLSMAAAGAMNGTRFDETFLAWRLAAEAKPGFDKDRALIYRDFGQKIYDRFSAASKAAEPFAQRLFEGLKHERQSSASYGGKDLVQNVLGAPAEIRPLIYAKLFDLAHKEGEVKEKGGQFWQAFGRGLVQMGIALDRKDRTGDLETAEKTLGTVKAGDEFGGRYKDFWAFLTKKTGAYLEAKIFTLDGLLFEPLLDDKKITAEDITAARSRIDTGWERIGEEMKLEQMGTAVLDPIKGHNWVQQNLVYGFAQSVLPQLAVAAALRRVVPPVMSGSTRLAAAVNGAVAGAPSIFAIQALMADQNTQQLMDQNPGMSVKQARDLGRQASYLQTGLEYAQDLLALGGFKAVRRAFEASRGALFKTAGKQFLLQTAAQNGMEAAQDLLPNIVAAFHRDAPAQDWDAIFYGKESVPPVTVRTVGSDGDAEKPYNLWRAGDREFKTEPEARAYASKIATREGGFWAQRTDTFLTLLPMVALGSLRHAPASLRPQIERAAAGLTDELLHAAGIPEAQRAAILATPDAAARLEALQSALPDADQATAEEGAAHLQQQRDTEAEQLRAAMQSAGVTMEPATAGDVPIYRVTTRDGTSTDHATVTDALHTVNTHLAAASPPAHETGEPPPADKGTPPIAAENQPVDESNPASPTPPASAAASKPAASIKDDPRIRETFGEDWAPGYDDQGLPRGPRTVPDGDPLLKPTVGKKASESKKTAIIPKEHLLVKTGLLEPGEIPRKQLHEAIIKHFLSRATPLPDGTRPTIYFTGGGGGSGKSTVRERLTEEGEINTSQAVIVDADQIKELIPEYKELVRRGDERAADMVQKESNDIAASLRNRTARPEGPRYDIVYDATLANKDASLKLIGDFKAAGYHTRLIAATLDVREALIRAALRAKDKGRWVPYDTLRDAHAKFSAAFESYAEAVDAAGLYDTTLRKPKLLGSKSGRGEPFTVVDPVGYAKLKQRSMPYAPGKP
ncbi:MAG TPA: zeta toxin family protein [Verrucomicrobiales bacterium]|nr:zeta toxin family protein [Verrucomicrobiales bacterium]